jgi:deoxyribodipyrimidine photolyase-like uncharacterized protein
VDVEIHPEPSSVERAAIEAAVATVLGTNPENRSAWWHAGLIDAVDDDDDRS